MRVFQSEIILVNINKSILYQIQNQIKAFVMRQDLIIYAFDIYLMNANHVLLLMFYGLWKSHILKKS